MNRVVGGIGLLGEERPTSPRLSTVLVIEDDHAVADLIRSTLEAAGMHAVTIDRGDRVVPALQALPVDAIVLDLMLPGRSGLRILDDLKTHPDRRSIPVVVVSAVAGLVPPAMRRHLIEVISKPFDLDDLVAAVRRAVASEDRATAGSDAAR